MAPPESGGGGRDADPSADLDLNSDLDTLADLEPRSQRGPKRKPSLERLVSGVEYGWNPDGSRPGSPQDDSKIVSPARQDVGATPEAEVLRKASKASGDRGLHLPIAVRRSMSKKSGASDQGTGSRGPSPQWPDLRKGTNEISDGLTSGRNARNPRGTKESTFSTGSFLARRMGRGTKESAGSGIMDMARVLSFRPPSGRDESEASDGLSRRSADDDDDNMMDLNQPGIIPVTTICVTWIAISAATLLAMIYVYAFQMVSELESQSLEMSVAYARLHTAEVLQPLVAVTTGLDVAFRGGDVSNLSDYAGLMRVLTPHFTSYSSLRRVELADFGTYNGSVLFTTRYQLPGIEVLTDRDDCHMVPGKRGCAIQPLGVNDSTWYRAGYGEKAAARFWQGPEFLSERPHEAICDDLCYKPAYSFVSRILGGPEPSPTDPDATWSELLVKVTLDTDALQVIATKVEELSKGEAVLCTGTGEVLAASDQRLAMKVDEDTGDVRAALVWEMARPWAQVTDEYWIWRARRGQDRGTDGYTITAWTVDGTSNATAEVGQHVRLVLSIPTSAIVDDVLGPLVTVGIIVSVIPAVTIVIMTVVAAYFKLCKGKKAKGKGWKILQSRSRGSTKEGGGSSGSPTSRRTTKDLLGGLFPGGSRRTTKDYAAAFSPSRSRSGTMGSEGFEGRRSTRGSN